MNFTKILVNYVAKYFLGFLINQMMSKNQAFTTLVYQRGQIPQNDILKLKDANKTFNEIGFVADYIPYVFMLFKKNDLYLSTSQCSLQFQEYYNKFLSIEISEADVSSSDALKKLLFNQYANHNSFVKTDTITYIHNAKKHILNNALLYLTSSDNTSLNPTYLSCFVIDNDYIVKNIMMPELEDQGFLYIQDMKTGESLLQHGNVPASVANCKNKQMIAHNGKYYVIVNTHEELQWKIVTGVPISATYFTSDLHCCFCIHSHERTGYCFQKI